MLEETAAINVVHEHDMHHRGQIRETPIAFDLREAQSTLSHGAYRHDASCCLREFAHLLPGVGTRSTPSHARLDRERNAAYFTYLRFPESVRRMDFSTNRIECLDRSYKLTLFMRRAMPSPASVVYPLGSVAKEKTEGTYAKRLRYLKEWKIK